MALTERTRPYEVLVRFHADGTFAAHQIYIREILDGEAVVAAHEQPALPLDADDIGSVVGEALPGIQAAVTELVAQRDALQATCADQAARLAAVALVIAPPEPA